MEWFSQLTEEDFIYDLNATPDETSLLVPRAMALVSKEQGFTELLRNEAPPYRSYVAGLAYENRRAHLAEVGIGQELRLARDYENPYDPNAVAIAHGRAQLGFLPRPLARLIAPHIDTGLEFVGIVTSVERGAAPHVELMVNKR